MKVRQDFFNHLVKELDAKYFHHVKFYQDDKQDMEMHHTVELYSNGCLTYAKLIDRLAKACNDSMANIHTIVARYVEDFEGYTYEPIIVRKKFLYDGIELRIVERDEHYMNKDDITMRMTRVLAPNGGSIPFSIGHKWTLKKIIEKCTESLDVFKSMGADVKEELTKPVAL